MASPFNQHVKWLQKYTESKDKVQTLLDMISDKEGYAHLCALTGIELQTHITMLEGSIRARAKVDSEKGDANHIARTERERGALGEIKEIADNNQKKEAQIKKDKALAAAASESKLKEMQKPDAFPTLGEAKSIQPNNKIYQPPPKSTFKWGQPK